jgi:hypothetical protein
MWRSSVIDKFSTPLRGTFHLQLESISLVPACLWYTKAAGTAAYEFVIY